MHDQLTADNKLYFLAQSALTGTCLEALLRGLLLFPAITGSGVHHGRAYENELFQNCPLPS